MKHSIWKWAFGISLTVLILLVLFTFGIWALENATGALASALMSYADSDAFAYSGFAFGEFLSGFIGSPIFYVYIADLAALAVSFAAMILTRKQ